MQISVPQDNVDNKAKGRISKRAFQENKTRQIFRKNEHFLPLIRTRTCTYQGVRNVSFSENFGNVINECSIIRIILIFEIMNLCFYLHSQCYVSSFNWWIVKEWKKWACILKTRDVDFKDHVPKLNFGNLKLLFSKKKSK